MTSAARSLAEGRPLSILRRHAFATVLGLAVIATGMAYSFWWPWSAVHGWDGHYWSVPTDLWNTYRNAQYVSWGALPYIYDHNGYALVGLPGMAIVLAPVALIGNCLNLTISAPWALKSGLWLPHPSAWYLLGPAALSTNLILLLVCDHLMETVEVSRRRRHLALVGVAALSWPVTAYWGHPEDILALSCALLATKWAVTDRRVVRAGWLIGAGIAIQPLVVLVLPVWLGALGWRATCRVLARAAVIPAGLFAVVMIVNPSATWSALFHQANWPAIDRPSPWVALAPKISSGAVSSGPLRLASLALALMVGTYAGRRFRGDLLGLLWVAGLAFALRCVLEPVMCPYYVAPVAVTGFVVAMRARRGWLGAAVVSAGTLTVVTNFHAPPWIWYMEMLGSSAALMLVAFPRRTASRGRRLRLRRIDHGALNRTLEPATT